MAKGKLSMRKIREVLRLHHAAGMSVRAIARSVKAPPSTVGEYIRRAEVQGLSWPLPELLDDGELEHRLFPAPAPSGARRPLPDSSKVHRELRRKGVTLALLWQEYKASHPEGLQYSQLCERYRAFASTLNVVMRQSGAPCGGEDDAHYVMTAAKENCPKRPAELVGLDWELPQVSATEHPDAGPRTRRTGESRIEVTTCATSPTTKIAAGSEPATCRAISPA